MKIVKQNLWEVDCDLRFVTTNSFIKKNGELVMGRGAALEAKQRYPNLPFIAGKYITHLDIYGVMVLPGSGVHLFQVKYHWNECAMPGLIEHSFVKLHMFLEVYKGTVALNFPGIGNGQLARADVLPIVERYSHDRITVCEL